MEPSHALTLFGKYDEETILNLLHMTDSNGSTFAHICVTYSNIELLKSVVGLYQKKASQKQNYKDQVIDDVKKWLN